MIAFEELGVIAELRHAIDEMEWTLPTDIQAEAIPLILGGGDVLMAAERGSGKTGAFCVPILQMVWESLKDIIEGRTIQVAHYIPSEWTMSYYDRTTSLAVSRDGLRCQSIEPTGWCGCRATKAVHTKGAYYFETTLTDDGLCRVGWSTQTASLDLGTDILGYGYENTGKKLNSKQFYDYGSTYCRYDVIGCMLNLNDGEICYTKNGENLGVAFKLDQSHRADCYFPAVVLEFAEICFNFGDTPFKHPPPAPYVGISQAPKEFVKKNIVLTNKDYYPRLICNAPQAIIIEPTRELAEETYAQLNLFNKYLNEPLVKILLVVGGPSVKQQVYQLMLGTNIVVATPSGLQDFYDRNYLFSMQHFRFFVLDEADTLLKARSWRLVEKLHGKIPKITFDGRRLQTVVCSATLHDFDVKKMAEKLMRFPTWVDLKGEDAVPEIVHHVVVNVDPQKDRSWQNLPKQVTTDGVHSKDNIRSGNTTPETLSEAIKILKGEYCVRAIREHKMDRAIIFCRTKLDCDNMERYLKSFGNEFPCVCLQGERKANLEKFNQRLVKFLICTDVATRGIDISGLPFLINVTLPDEKSNYVRRTGRVGRAERMGLAISLVSTVPEKVWYHGEWCSSRGHNCWNTNLIDDRPKGCCMWYNEPQYLADIENLNITIQHVENDMKVPSNEIDGKVVYGQKREQVGSGYQDHVSEMAPVVRSLQELESKAQMYYLKAHHDLTAA